MPRKKRERPPDGQIARGPLPQSLCEGPSDQVTNVEAMPANVEYSPSTARGLYKVERFDLWLAEFPTPLPFSPRSVMTEFHDLVSIYPRQWLVIRRLFGISPVIMPPDADPDDFKLWTRDELQSALGVSGDELSAEIEAVRSIWKNTQEPEPRDTSPRPSPQSAEGERGEFNFNGDVLAELGFDESIFEAPETPGEGDAPGKPRLREEIQRERALFVKRVMDFKKMLTEPMAAELARSALLKELNLRRLENEMNKHLPTSPKYKALAHIEKDLQTSYRELMQQLNDICPWSASIGGKINFRGAVSEMFDGYDAYKREGDTALVDRINSASEVEILIRMSDQMPTPRYRLGQNLFIIEAMHGLHDPNYRTQFNHRTLKRMDEAFKRAIVALREESGEVLVDLEKESDEFPDLKEV